MLGLLATLTEQRNALQTVNDALSTQYRTAEDQLHAALADVRTATSRCAELEDVLCTKVRWSALLGCERPSAGRGKEGGGRSASVDRLCECARACLRPYIHLPQRPPPQKVCGTSQHQEAQDSRADGGHPRERYGECRRQRAWQITAALTCLTRCRTPWTKRRPPGGGAMTVRHHSARRRCVHYRGHRHAPGSGTCRGHLGPPRQRQRSRRGRARTWWRRSCRWGCCRCLWLCRWSRWSRWSSC